MRSATLRVAALWFPDWPVQAACLAEKVMDPAAVVRAGEVIACGSQARQAGVRRGMRLRQAQAVCPQLQVVEYNAERDGAFFTAIADSLDDVAPTAEVIRPGLVVVDAGAAGRFHGSEDKAVEMMLDATARSGVDAALGVADEIATAIIAARCQQGTVVPPGQSRTFLATQPVSVLAAEVALGFTVQFVEKCSTLGIRSLKDLAALPEAQVATRFAQCGTRAHRIASAAPDRRVAPSPASVQFAVSITPEDPIERVDTAAFIARQLAAQLHQKLARAGMVCARLKVSAQLSSGTWVERIWRTREPLAEQATADRVRWQLDGWLTRARAGEEGGIVELALLPVEVNPPGTDGLWGNPASSAQARRVITRVQSTLGADRVVTPHVAGGRGVAERIEFIPYGEHKEPAPQGLWPGRIPAPLPARLGGGLRHPAARMKLVTESGAPVMVTAEAVLSGQPYAAQWGACTYRVAGWAGPWPVDAQWWNADGAQPTARMQLVGQDPTEAVQRAWLIQWHGGGWKVEAAYF